LTKIDEEECLEWCIAQHIQKIVLQEKIYILDKLGIMIAPGSDDFFEI
jgi:hypothetical protein